MACHASAPLRPVQAKFTEALDRAPLHPVSSDIHILWRV